MNLRFFPVVCGLLLLTNCVSKSKYETLEKDRDAQVGDLTEKLKNAEKSAADRGAQNASLEEKLIATTKDRGQLKANLEDMKKAMAEMAARQAEEQKRIAEFKDLTNRFKALTDAGTLKIKIVEGRMVVVLGSDVLFSSGSAKLSGEGLKAIKDVTAKLNEIPDKKYQIEGHTDNVPISSASFPSNWELASARALTVVKSMIDNGMRPYRISAASFGDTKPVQPNDSSAGKAANRRIEIVIVPDLSTLPGYEELQKLSK